MSGPPPLTRARHRAALLSAAEHLDAAEQTDLPELRGEDLRLAMRALGRITGHVGVEDAPRHGVLSFLYRKVIDRSPNARSSTRDATTLSPAVIARSEATQAIFKAAHAPSDFRPRDFPSLFMTTRHLPQRHRYNKSSGYPEACVRYIKSPFSPTAALHSSSRNPGHAATASVRPCFHSS